MELSVNKYEIIQLNQENIFLFQKLIHLFQEVFEMENIKEVNSDYLCQLLQKPAFIVFVVVVENEVIGGLTAYELPMYYAPSSEVFIYDIAIQTKFQRKGWGKKLISALKNYCQQRHIPLIFVEALEEDESAVDFYRRTGGKEEKVAHFNYFLDESNH